MRFPRYVGWAYAAATHCNTLQHNTLQHTATHLMRLMHEVSEVCVGVCVYVCFMCVYLYVDVGVCVCVCVCVRLWVRGNNRPHVYVCACVSLWGVIVRMCIYVCVCVCVFENDGPHSGVHSHVVVEVAKVHMYK